MLLGRLAAMSVLAWLCGVASCNAIFSIDELGGPTNAVASSVASSGSGGSDAASSAASQQSASSNGVGGAGGSGGSGAGGSGGAGAVGCSDGTREFFLNPNVYPDIAGCSGGWSEPGLTSAASMMPQCNREAGDDGARPNGSGCSVADLCAQGWHVCVDKDEVAMNTVLGCTTVAMSMNEMWIVRAGGPANTSDCSGPGTNNLFGCGAGLGPVAPGNCAPLDASMRHVDCTSAPAWDCGPNANNTIESEIVIKDAPIAGGVLCCVD